MHIETLDWNSLKSKLPTRPQDCHKYTFGHALIIGGAPGLSGAVRLAAEAAARIGAGAVSVATHPDHAALLNIGRPELMCHGLTQFDQLDELIHKASIINLGPGLGRAIWGPGLAQKILATDKPIVLDADGLHYLSIHVQKREQWILTPHPGEAARLLNTTSAAIQQNRITAIKEIQDTYGGTIILKGANTLIATHSGQIFQNPYGNPAMATAGMGDVLSGIIAGLWAQGLNQDDAAQLGVAIHSLAADYLVNQKKYRTILAQDINECLGWVINKM